MNASKLLLGLVMALAFAVPGAASATPLNFSYETEGGDVLAGMMQGTIQADLDTVIVDSVSMVTFGGYPVPDAPFVTSVSDYLNSAVPALVSFSGSTMDFCAAIEPCAIEGFLFGITGEGGLVFNSSGDFGGVLETFAPERWSLSVKSVPEPATLALFGLGLIGLGVTYRKRMG